MVFEDSEVVVDVAVELGDWVEVEATVEDTTPSGSG